MMMRRRGVHVVRPLEGCDHKLSRGAFFRDPIWAGSPGVVCCLLATQATKALTKPPIPKASRAPGTLVSQPYSRVIRDTLTMRCRRTVRVALTCAR